LRFHGWSCIEIQVALLHQPALLAELTDPHDSQLA